MWRPKDGPMTSKKVVPCLWQAPLGQSHARGTRQARSVAKLRVEQQANFEPLPVGQDRLTAPPSRRLGTVDLYGSEMADGAVMGYNLLHWQP
jgi:hypothetical protein